MAYRDVAENQDVVRKRHTVHSGHRRRGYRRAGSQAGAVDLAKVFDAGEPWAARRNEDLYEDPSRYCCSNRRLKAIGVR